MGETLRNKMVSKIANVGLGVFDESNLSGLSVTNPDGHVLGICNADHHQFIPQEPEKEV
ncbi:MAG TPA: hypothetical protein VFK33_08320 [Bacillales bacterium]|nr:hypothetical protein [Bacillales bacterium]